MAPHLDEDSDEDQNHKNPAVTNRSGGPSLEQAPDQDHPCEDGEKNSFDADDSKKHPIVNRSVDR